MAERGDLLSRLRSVDEVLADARPRAHARRSSSPSFARRIAPGRRPRRHRRRSCSPRAVRSASPPRCAPPSRWPSRCAPAITRRDRQRPRRAAETRTKRSRSIAIQRRRSSRPPRAPRGRAPRRRRLARRRSRRPANEGRRRPPRPRSRMRHRDSRRGTKRSLPFTAALVERRASALKRPVAARAPPCRARSEHLRRAARALGRGPPEATAKQTSAPARRGQATTPAPLANPRTDGCEPAESLIDRARADCESQSLTLSDHGLATLDACGDGRFRGLDYACAPPQHPHAPRAPRLQPAASPSICPWTAPASRKTTPASKHSSGAKTRPSPSLASSSIRAPVATASRQPTCSAARKPPKRARTRPCQE